MYLTCTVFWLLCQLLFHTKYSVADVQLHPTALFSYMRRGCSTTNGRGVQFWCYIQLNDEEKEIFEKFAGCTTEMHDLTEREAFVKGYTIGASIIIEVMAAGGEE